jgi:hypothetical protein
VRPAHQVALQHLADHVTGYIDVLSSGRYEAVLAGPSGIKQASPVTFSTQAAASRYLARANDILKNASAAAQETAGSPAQESINGVGQESANSGYTTAKQHDWSIGLPCGFTCGADNSGGAHFWVIASYQQIANASLIAAFSAGCMAYLVPEIQGWAAPACGAAVYLLKTLAANEPRVPNHGVWAAIYFSHPWSPQGGRY